MSQNHLNQTLALNPQSYKFTEMTDELEELELELELYIFVPYNLQINRQLHDVH